MIERWNWAGLDLAVERIGLDGKPIKRTPEEYPYSYDAFFEYKAPDYQESDRMVYHDRMKQWDRQGFGDASHQIWLEGGQEFFGKGPRDIQKFLCLYFKKEVHLTGILRGCNVSNGYPRPSSW